MSPSPEVWDLDPDWPTCAAAVEPACPGIRASGFDRCLTHLTTAEFETVLDRLEPGADLDLRGTTLDSDVLERLLTALTADNERGARIGFLHGTRTRFTGTAWFARVRFEGTAGFVGARFEGTARFDDAHFARHAGFTSARFARDAGFDDAHFGGTARFAAARFAGHAWFDDVRFEGTARFDDAHFARHAEFVRAHFAGNTQFACARFAGYAGFAGAHFQAAGQLGPLSAAEVVLDGAVFCRRMVVEAAAHRVSCDGARFEEGMALRLRHTQVSFQNVTLGGPSSIQGNPHAFPTILGAEGTPPEEDPSRAADQPEPEPGAGTYPDTEDLPVLLSVRETDLSEMLLIDVDLRWCRFAGAHHLDLLRIEGRSPFDRPPTGWHAGWAWPPVWRWTRRSVLAEEHHWRHDQRKSRGWRHGHDQRKARGWHSSSPGQDAVAAVGPVRLAALYRSLRKSLEDSKDQAGAGDFYYGEMEARRHSGPVRDRVVLSAYWLLSGYGQRVLRPLVALAALVGVITVLLVGWGLPDSPPPQQITGTLPVAEQQVTLAVRDASPTLPPAAQRWNWNRAGKAAQIAMSSVVFRDGGQKLTPAGTWTIMAGRFLGPALLLLAILAIRARVKR
ncbi:pentapeptide repeat-containing protein [Amycolatopsis aidingensis]|uniref:pentapeptide repeat-containing protein n=1 Tax=Amycolatopsis aidingensis TaxID=2842453 RepID=UPI001C0E0C6C|nr:pentapeptide repeat-containing protein [Amycolatopsis aidingensis]